MAVITNKSPIIRLDKEDNIVVARAEIKAGTFIPEENVIIKNDIPLGHKFAAHDIKKGETILKYNTAIGTAARDIAAGEHVHINEIHFERTQKEYEYCVDYKPLEIVPEEKRRTFMGIVREDGRIATRNCICVIVCSNCAATVARKIADHFDEEILRQFPNVDAVVPLIHQSGCGPVPI